ncbi:MAG: HAMP domain-containing sensor histidine kinase [Pseudomonadota bacterium]
MASVTASTTPQTPQGHNPASEISAAPVSAGAADLTGGSAGEEERAAEAGATSEKRASLARRMGFIAAAWIIVLLLGGGIALERTLTAQVQDNLDEQLQNTLNAMIVSVEIDPLGEAYFNLQLGDQKFLEPNSGRYWQINGEGLEPYPSRSLWDDRTLELRGGDPDGEAYFYTSDQFADEQLRIAERTVILPGSDRIWTFAVARITAERDVQITRVRFILFWSFAVLALGLIGMALLQVRYGLSPLRRVRAAISKLRTTGDNRITEPLPLEVQPLVDEVNALLEHTERQAEEARRHAGNLAHALKTPLTVLTNAATARDPDIAEAVFRETRQMQRHVDHHLARARAVGRRAVGHARTNVRESAEAVRRAVERLYPEGRLDIAGGKTAQVAIERQDLDEILGNLIENAAKYGGGSVFVTIDAEPEAEQCVIWVEDDGTGIPEKERVRIFDRGARLDTGKPGTGLGLAIVRDVAEIYGGGAKLGESEDLGGLMVELSLPRA